MSFEIDFKPPAKQNLAFLKFHRQYGPKYFGILGILSFFKDESLDENLKFALSIAFNRIFQFGRGLLTSRLHSQPF